MNFLDHIELNPKVSLEKGKIYPFVEMANVSATNREPNAIQLEEYTSGVKFEDYDTVIARIEPCLQNGKKFFVKNIGKGFGSTEYLVFRPKDETVDSVFLYYFMQTDFIRKSMIGSMTGSTGRQRVNNDIFKSLEISLPNIEKQKIIGSYLSSYDDLIANNQKQIKLLEEMAQRLYKEWFVDLHFPGYENTKIVDGVPEGWRIVTLEKVISKITTGLNPRKNFTLGQGHNFYVTIKNMGENTFILDEKCDKVDDEAIEKINKRSDLQIGDLLFSGIGTMGRVALIDIPTNNWNVSESVFTMRANNYVSKEFLFLLLLSHDVQMYCDQHSHGVAQKGIRMADLKAYKFCLPNENLMTNFTKIVKPIIDRTQILRKQNIENKEARDRLLPKLMSGEIEV